MGEARHHDTCKVILILCYLEPLQIMAWLKRDWDVFGKVAQHHISDFIAASEALRTIEFTVYLGFFPGAGTIAASFIQDCSDSKSKLLG